MIRMPRHVRRLGQAFKVGDCTDCGVNLAEISNVVTVVLVRRGIDRHEPKAVDAEILQVVELGCQADQIAVAVAVGIKEATRVDFIENRILVP